MIINKKTILIIALVFSLIVTILTVYYFSIPRSYIKIELAPHQAYLNIDKNIKNITNGKNLSISPGKHSLVFYRDQFSSFSQNIDIKRNETITLTVALKALTTEAKNILNTDESNKIIEKYTSIKLDKQSDSLDANYPILKILPINNKYYQLFSCKSQKYPNDSSKIALCVIMDDLGYSDTLYEEAQRYGYNLNDYELIWNIK